MVQLGVGAVGRLVWCSFVPLLFFTGFVPKVRECGSLVDICCDADHILAVVRVGFVGVVGGALL